MEKRGIEVHSRSTRAGVFGASRGLSGLQRGSRYLRPFLVEDLRLGMVHLCAIRGDYEGAWHRNVGGHDRDGDY